MRGEMRGGIWYELRIVVTRVCILTLLLRVRMCILNTIYEARVVDWTSQALLIFRHTKAEQGGVIIIRFTLRKVQVQNRASTSQSILVDSVCKCFLSVES